jgi:hypothetical protein
MSPLQANTHIAEATIIGKINDEDYRNRIHFSTETMEWDTNGLQLLTTLCTELSADVVSGFLGALSNEFQFIGVAAKRIAPDTSDIVEVFTDAGPGGVAGQALPSFNCMLAHKKSGKGGRKGRGRMFLPPPLEAHADKGKLIAAGVAVIEEFLDGLRTHFIGAGGSSVWSLGVLNNVYDNATPPNITDRNWFPSAALVADDLIAVQRRRKIGRGS